MMEERSHKFISEYSIRGSVIWKCTYCVLALFVVVTYGQSSGPDPVIITKWGPVRGRWSMSLNNRPIASFLRIPYAEPPLGDLRFKSPQRWNRTWTTIRDGKVDGPKCAQLSDLEMIGSEDCLYLNVFMPMIPSNQPARLPVMVYVHGGSFLVGSSDSKRYAPDYLLDHDVILVTLNYRLNVLGFFSTANRVAPGNYGLKDIIAALYWVQENIHIFGGNPESVTMMGSSAGAASVHLLALSNKSEGLFHRYILHSGSALSPWAVHSRLISRRIYLEVARMVGCLPTPINNVTAWSETNFNPNSGNKNDGMYDTSANNVKQDENMMKCLRTVDASEMLNVTKNIYYWRNNPGVFITPVLEEESEDAVVTMHPLKILRDGLFRDMPAIIEVTQDEGLVKTIDFIINPGLLKEIIENFEEYLPYVMESQDIISNTSVYADAIRDFYFGGNLTVSDDFTSSMTKLVGDGTITWPLFRAAQYQSKIENSSIYLSLFAYQGTFSWTFEYSPILYGVCHADDLNYLFPVLNNIFEDRMLHNTENDRTMINLMTEMWTNFAKDGVPRAWTIPAWPDYRDHHQFMRFGIGVSPDIVVQADFLSARMEFWEKLMADVSTEFDVKLVNTGDDANNMIVSGAADHGLTLASVLIAIVGALI